MASTERAGASAPTEVLVVGAGPTGLTMAASLAKLGVRARVVDKNSARTGSSQALGVQAGSLEALGQFFGDELPRQMVAAGYPTREGLVHFGDRPAVKVDFSQIPSIYNFILVLPQSETERFLEEQVARYSLAVERQTELVSLADTGTHVVAELKSADGRREQVAADYVVGCDGAHSTVRHAANIAYAGGAYTGDFILGDVVIRWSLPNDTVHLFFTENGILACLPIRPETAYYRLILVAPGGQSPDAMQAEISPDEFCRVLAPLSPIEIKITDFVWLARFRLHHRMAERFRNGRLFLAGDAAHIHSPVGAQGMNTGIQDALSLASKLAAVIRGGAPVGTLDEYEQQRLPVARGVVRGTDLAFRFVGSANHGLSGWLRATIGPHLIGSRFVQKRLARIVSQVDVARRDIEYRTRLAARVAAGRRGADG